MAIQASKAIDTIPAFDLIPSSSNSVISYRAGTRIFRAGDTGDCAYMINKGYVEIYKDNNGTREILEILGPGDIFGEMELLDGNIRKATAIAAHDTTVYSISREQLQEELDRAGPITRQILTASVNRASALQSRQLHAANPAADCKPSSDDNEIQYRSVRMDAARQLKQRYDLENAIKTKQFKLAYQPIVNLRDGRIAGFEALIRWPQLGNRVVTPDEFIPLAEQSRMIVPLGAWTLEAALQALSCMARTAPKRHTSGCDIFVSINVSPRQLENDVDVEQLASLIEQSNVNPACVKIEITEQALLADPRMATIALARLKSTGVSIAIDDFGTGYSSLNYLYRFPIDTLKIDRSFISRIVDDRNRQRVVAAIIGLAHELDMNVVAEGVEQTDELRWLSNQKCGYAQGYLLAKPMPFSEALNQLERSFDL